MHAFIKVKAVDKDLANRLAEQQGWGPNTFSVGVNSTGSPNDPITDYICAPEIHGNNWNVILGLKQQIPDAITEQYNLDTQSNYVDIRLTELGLKRIQASFPI